MSIFVGNLPFRAEREDVIQLFAPFGEVLNCSLPLERDTGRKRGFAFIEMADEAIESTAIDGLQGTELMGRPLRINKAEPRGSGGSRRGGRGGYGGGNNGGNNGGGNGYGGGNNGGGYGVATAVVIMVVAMVVAATAVVIIMVAMVVAATVVVIWRWVIWWWLRWW